MADGTSLRLLLDTSAVLHLASGTLSSAAADALRSGGLAVLSAVVPWELAIKVNKGDFSQGRLSKFGRGV